MHYYYIKTNKWPLKGLNNYTETNLANKCFSRNVTLNAIRLQKLEIIPDKPYMYLNARIEVN